MDEAVQSIVLRCQIQLEVTRRTYRPEEQARLRDLFGDPDRWSQTLRSMLWTHATAIVPPFVGSTDVELPVACTFDFNVAATKYFHGLSDGDVPLCFLFSGTVFYQDAAGRLEAAPIAWNCEARYRLPQRVWHERMESYYPSSVWLALGRDTFERVYAFKVQRGIPTWDEALDRLVSASRERAG